MIANSVHRGDTWGQVAMRSLAVAVWLCVGVASMAEAQPPDRLRPIPFPIPIIHAAPAPVIGAGIPAFLVVAGVLLGALVKRWPQS